MFFCYIYNNKIFKLMKLAERLNVLIQATTLSQKNGSLTLDEAVKAKSAIDVISSGNINQNYASAINVLIEIAVTSQKKGAFSLKDAYMVYLAIDGIEHELNSEVNRLSTNTVTNETKKETSNNETIVTIPPKVF